MVGVVLCRPAPVTAQDVSAPSLKAAFLMNFVKFAEWPAGAVARGQVFTFCVAGDQSVFKEVSLSIKRYSRPNLMTVVYVDLAEPLPVCHMVYFGGPDLQAARRVGESLQGAPVFTVSDMRGFAEAGGIAELWLDKGKMRFSINAAAARRAHLALSAKLLSLATLVKETS